MRQPGAGTRTGVGFASCAGRRGALRLRGRSALPGGARAAAPLPALPQRGFVPSRGHGASRRRGRGSCVRGRGGLPPPCGAGVAEAPPSTSGGSSGGGSAAGAAVRQALRSRLLPAALPIPVAANRRPQGAARQRLGAGGSGSGGGCRPSRRSPVTPRFPPCCPGRRPLREAWGRLSEGSVYRADAA